MFKYLPPLFVGMLILSVLISNFFKSKKDEKAVLKKSFAFYLSLGFGILLTILNFCKWEFDVFSRVGLEFLLFGLFILTLFFSFIYIFRFYFGQKLAKTHFKTTIPLFIVLIFVLVNHFLYYPFTRFNLRVDFLTKLKQREKVIEMIKSGELLPDQYENIELPSKFSGLSKDDSISIDNEMVTFFTFRGILGNGSGFVYTQNDALPTRQNLGWCDELLDWSKYSNNWYWVTCSS